jgi:hypothetical protein
MAIKIPSSKIYDNQHTLYKNFISEVNAQEKELELEKRFDEPVLTVSENFEDDSRFSFVKEASDYATNDLGTHFMYIESALSSFIDGPNAHKAVSNDGLKIITKIDETADDIESVYVLKERKYTWLKDNGQPDYESNHPQTTNNIPPPENSLTGWNKYEENVTQLVSIPDVIFADTGYINDAVRIPRIEYSYGESYIIVDRTSESVGSFYTTVIRKAKTESVSGYGYIANSGNHEWFSLSYSTIELQTLNYSVNGNQSIYNVKGKTRTFGDGSDYYEMPSNELFQKTTKLSGVPITEATANSFVKDFRNGKETYELLCSVKEYYNEDGTLAISTKGQVCGKTKMLFEIGDEVIPYKPTVAGDKPISYKKGGKTPKTFIVVGVTPIFDGAVWQRLNLIEKTIESVTVQTPEIKEEDYIDTGNIGTPFVVTKENKYYLGNSVDHVFYNGKEITSNTTGIEYLTVGPTTALVMALLKDGNLVLSITASGIAKTEFQSKSYEFVLS